MLEYTLSLARDLAYIVASLPPSILSVCNSSIKKYSLTISGGYLIDFRFISKKCKIADVKMPAQKGS